MDYYIVFGIIIPILLVIGLISSIRDIVLSHKIAVQSKELELNNQEASEYLESVKRRANLTIMPESIELLFDEIIASTDKFTYNRNHYEEFLKISAYLRGKYHGLKKISIKI